VDFELTLLYRGSEQNFTHDNFKRLVGNQGPTLHIIKSQHDNLFGGCAFEKYPDRKNDKDEYKEDAKAFVFQLHPNQVKLKNKLEETSKKFAIRC
jgi:BTB/POZ domain-containing protein KCTD9